MSDFSGLEQSFALSAVPTMAVDVSDYLRPMISNEVQPHEVTFKRLRGAHEIARILHLREEIALPLTALADASFAAREKKEMN